MQSKIWAITLAIFLVGCATKKQEVVITVPPTYSENIPVPVVEPVKVEGVNWILLNKQKTQEFISGSDEFLLYTLDDAGMKALIGNVTELRRYIMSQQAKIEYLLSVINARVKKGDNGSLQDPGRSP